MTPEQIEKRQFTVRRASKGYDPDEVDDFLDEVAEAYRRMEDAYSREVHEREVLQRRMSDAPTQVIPPAFNDAVTLLNVAKETQERMIREAGEEADRMRATAEKEAADIVAAGHEKRHVIIGQLEEKREGLEQHVDALQRTMNAIRGSMKMALEAIGDGPV